jgi:hypothetical protein
MFGFIINIWLSHGHPVLGKMAPSITGSVQISDVHFTEVQKYKCICLQKQSLIHCGHLVQLDNLEVRSLQVVAHTVTVIKSE